MKRGIIALFAVLALTTVACDDAEKKAQEAAAAASATAKIAADKAAEDAKIAAAADVKKVLETKRADFKKQVDGAAKLMDQKLTFLKEKAAKLALPVKAKADAAFGSFDTAKATLLALNTSADNATDVAAFSELGNKMTAARADAQKALDAAEAIVIPAKK